MAERYAIYFAPSRDSQLWLKAARWLGRDAAEDECPEPFVPDGLDADAFQAATADPRRYGFHATLKPPMRLATGVGFDQLEAVAKSLAARLAPVRIGRLAPRLLGPFLALMPENQTPALTRLAADCVAFFEPLRAPLTQKERLKHMQSGLTGHQLQLLDQYGYPYVLDQFRFHMTLTGRLDPEQADAHLAAARKYFAGLLAGDWTIDALCIYHEPAPGLPFRRLADFALSGPD